MNIKSFDTNEKKVPAIEKADKIFEYLFEKERATQATLARELDIPKATTNRLLAVLTEYNYLEFHEGDYSLGKKFQVYSHKKDKHSLIRSIAYPYLEELALKLNEGFKLSVLDGNVIRALAKVGSGDLDKFRMSANTIFPLHAGAASKLLICQLNETQLNKILIKNLPKYTETTITDREVLKKELFKINIKKVAYDNREHSSKIAAVALPILNEKNKIVAAISCPYIYGEVSEEELDFITKEMKIVTEEISKRLRYFK